MGSLQNWTPLFVFLMGMLSLPAAAQWRVDQLGVLMPDPRARTTTSFEGGMFADTFKSEIRLAFITGETSQSTVAVPRQTSTQWIYDVERRATINLTEALHQLVPNGGHPQIRRVTAYGIAIGSIELPSVNGIPQFLPWVVVDGDLSIAQPPPPPPQVPSGGYSDVYYEDFSGAKPILARSYFQDSQTHYIWREKSGSSRFIGFYDEEHRGTYNGFQNLYSVGFLEFAAPYRDIAVGWSSRWNGVDYIGQTSWIDDGEQTVRIGLYDALHTQPNTGRKSSQMLRTTPNGWIVGASESFNADATRQSLWKYHVATGETTRIGLADALHTDPATGLAHAVLGSGDAFFGGAWLRAHINSFGEVIGHSESFGPAGERGRSAWLARRDGFTVPVGLTIAQFPQANGLTFNTPIAVNEAGQVVGVATPNAAADSVGAAAPRAVWFHDGTNSRRIGLFGPEHSRSTDSYQFSDLTKFDDQGQAWGQSQRFSPTGAALGPSAWTFDGHETHQRGLVDAAHTDPETGFQSSLIQRVNSTGQVLGSSVARGLPFRPTTPRSTFNSSDWLYDPATGYHSLVFDVSGDGKQFDTNPLGLSDEGVVVGMYRRFGDDPSDVGQLRPFRWSISQGMIDVGDVLESTYPTIKFESMNLLDPESALAGQFLIEADLRGTLPLRTEQALFLVTVVPEPSAATILLMMAVPIALRARARRWQA